MLTLVRSSLILQACVCLFACKQSDNNLFFFFFGLSALAGLDLRSSLGTVERGLISQTAAGNGAYARMGGIFPSSISLNPGGFVKSSLGLVALQQKKNVIHRLRSVCIGKISATVCFSQ